MILGDNSPYKRLDIGNVFPRVFIYLFVYLYTLYGASNQKKNHLDAQNFFSTFFGVGFEIQKSWGYAFV